MAKDVGYLIECRHYQKPKPVAYSFSTNKQCGLCKLPKPRVGGKYLAKKWICKECYKQCLNDLTITQQGV